MCGFSVRLFLLTDNGQVVYGQQKVYCGGKNIAWRQNRELLVPHLPLTR